MPLSKKLSKIKFKRQDEGVTVKRSLVGNLLVIVLYTSVDVPKLFMGTNWEKSLRPVGKSWG